ncbi:MAG: hypothetical protein P8020_10410 [Acidobacteriota bacterium]|jgi:hypothetical protein
MSRMFLDPRRPLTTCLAENCEGCPVSKDIHCHFQFRDLIAFLFAVVPCFVVGAVGVYRVGVGWLALWALAVLTYFGFVEIRVMCSHCPHYAEPGKNLQCWANYGSPRLWKYRPGPMTAMERAVFESGLFFVMAYPLVFLLAESQWLLLVLYVLTLGSFFVTLQRSFCSQCMNFACSFNSVDEKTRAEFFRRNPTIARAWAKSID